MEYKWHVDILLKDRKDLIRCIWKGPETMSTAVAKKKSSTPNLLISLAFTDCQIITMSW